MKEIGYVMFAVFIFVCLGLLVSYQPIKAVSLRPYSVYHQMNSCIYITGGNGGPVAIAVGPDNYGTCE